jgi:hypothetical protein
MQRRAIAQAVSRRLPTAAAWVRTRVRSCRICGGQIGTGAGFLRILRFPLPIIIPTIAPPSPSSIIRGWYSRTNSGLSIKSAFVLSSSRDREGPFRGDALDLYPGGNSIKPRPVPSKSFHTYHSSIISFEAISFSY